MSKGDGSSDAAFQALLFTAQFAISSAQEFSQLSSSSTKFNEHSNPSVTLEKALTAADAHLRSHLAEAKGNPSTTYTSLSFCFFASY